MPRCIIDPERRINVNSINQFSIATDLCDGGNSINFHPFRHLISNFECTSRRKLNLKRWSSIVQRTPINWCDSPSKEPEGTYVGTGKYTGWEKWHANCVLVFVALSWVLITTIGSLILLLLFSRTIGDDDDEDEHDAADFFTKIAPSPALGRLRLASSSSVKWHSVPTYCNSKTSLELCLTAR